MNAASPELPDSRHALSRLIRDGGLFWLLAGLLLLIATVPLPKASSWLGAKAFAFEAVAIVLGVLVVSSGEWTRARALAAITAAPNVAIGALLLWVGISAARSPVPELSNYEAMRHVGGGLIYFSIVYGLSVRRHLGKLVLVLLITASLAALLAFVGATDGHLDRMSGAMRNGQLLAGLLCLTLPVVLVVSQMDDDPWRRYAAQAAAVIVIAGILVCKNRSAWLGTVVALVVMLALYAYCAHRERALSVRKHQLLLPAATLVLAGGLFFMVSRMEGGLTRRAFTLTQLTADASFQWRLAMWNKCLRMANDRPLTGWGIGTFPVQQALYFHPHAPSRSQLDIMQTGPRLTENAHNTYLQMAAETGYTGIVFYLGVFAAFFGTAFRALRGSRPGFRRALLIGSMAAVAGQMVAAIGTPAWEFPECSLFLWVILGMGMAAAGVGNRGRE
jgi:O-antigen ligase